MSAKIIEVPSVSNFVSARKMHPGQIGTFRYRDEKIIALRTYTEIVDLNHPVRTWNLDASYLIELLPEGSRIQIVAEAFEND